VDDIKNLHPRDNLCYAINLKRAANSITKFYDKMLEQTAVTVSQFSLLNDIKLIEPCSKSGLAVYAKLDPSTITRNIKLLKKDGYINDDSAPGSRESQISLSVLGHEKVSAGLALWKKAQRRIQEEIGPEALNQLKKTLEIIENID
jgi:DNA-binding MarR family transcriptional regulator